MSWATGLRAAGVGLGAIIAVWGSIPAFTGRFHAGCFTMLLVGALLCVVCLRFSEVSAWVAQMWQHTAGKVVLSVVCAVAAALVVLFAVVSGLMLRAAHNHPIEDATLVVLGAALRGDQPSRLLRGRLDAAAAYLQEHPKAVCVVSGGQGPDEICTEASVMKRYLLEKGIAPDRIYMEEQSTSTFENVKFSKEIIEKNQLNSNIAMVTQEFHQYRAQQFAKKAGFAEVGAVTAHTPLHLLASYWIRDFAGVCHMVLLGT